MHRAIYLPMLVAAAFAQVVTEVADVEVDGNLEHVRKINGRWWSNDNRQMYPPAGSGGFFWIIDRKSENRFFNHHRPFRLALAESLHLFMSPEAVRQASGEPNEETLGREGEPIFYRYYAADGTCVSVRFMQNHLLGEAKYERRGGPLGGVMVSSVDRDLGGRSIYDILSKQARQQVDQRAAERRLSHGRGPMTTTGGSVVPVEPFQPAPPPARRVTPEVWKKVTVGMTRAEVIAQLGEPLSATAIAGAEPAVETLLYAFESAGDARVRLEAGKVIRITP